MAANEREQMTPADLAVIDQGHAMYREALNDMQESAREALENHGPMLGLVVVAQALRENPGWDRDLLLMVLATALIEDARRG
jgi:hypothetical protein